MVSSETIRKHSVLVCSVEDMLIAPILVVFFNLARIRGKHTTDKLKPTIMTRSLGFQELFNHSTMSVTPTTQNQDRFVVSLITFSHILHYSACFSHKTVFLVHQNFHRFFMISVLKLS